MMITGQGNGQGGREHGQKCDQLPGQRSIADPAAREHVARVWGIAPEEIPQAGLLARSRSWRRSTAARSRRCSRSASTRSSRCPTPTSRARRSRSSSSSASIDFFLSETAHHADVVLAGSLQEEDEGVVVQRRRPRHPHPARRSTRRATRAPTGAIICDLARRLGKGQYFPYRVAARDLRRAARGLARRHRRLLRHHLREDRPRDGRLLALPVARIIPARRASSRAAASSIPTARRASCVTEWRPSGDPRGRGVPGLPDDRPRGQPVPLGHADAPHRRAGRPVPGAARRDPSAAGRDARHRDGDWVTVTTRRGEITLAGDGRAHDPARHRLHPVPLAGRRSANRLTHRTLDPRSKIPEFKVSACRMEKAAGPPDWAAKSRRPIPLPVRSC